MDPRPGDGEQRHARGASAGGWSDGGQSALALAPRDTPVAGSPARKARKHGKSRHRGGGGKGMVALPVSAGLTEQEAAQGVADERVRTLPATRAGAAAKGQRYRGAPPPMGPATRVSAMSSTDSGGTTGTTATGSSSGAAVRRRARRSPTRSPSGQPSAAGRKFTWDTASPERDAQLGRGSASNPALGDVVPPPLPPTEPWVAPLSPVRWGVGTGPDGEPVPNPVGSQSYAHLLHASGYDRDGAPNGQHHQQHYASAPTLLGTDSRFMPAASSMAGLHDGSGPDLWWLGSDGGRGELDFGLGVPEAAPTPLQTAIDGRMATGHESQSRFAGPAQRAPNNIRSHGPSFPKGVAEPGSTASITDKPQWLAKAQQRAQEAVATVAPRPAGRELFVNPSEAALRLQTHPQRRSSFSDGDLGGSELRLARPTWNAGPGARATARYRPKPLPKFLFGPRPRDDWDDDGVDYDGPFGDDPWNDVRRIRRPRDRRHRKGFPSVDRDRDGAAFRRGDDSVVPRVAVGDHQHHDHGIAQHRDTGSPVIGGVPGADALAPETTDDAADSSADQTVVAGAATHGMGKSASMPALPGRAQGARNHNSGGSSRSPRVSADTRVAATAAAAAAGAAAPRSDVSLPDVYSAGTGNRTTSATSRPFTNPLQPQDIGEDGGMRGRPWTGSAAGGSNISNESSGDGRADFGGDATGDGARRSSSVTRGGARPARTPKRGGSSEGSRSQDGPGSATTVTTLGLGYIPESSVAGARLAASGGAASTSFTEEMRVKAGYVYGPYAEMPDPDTGGVTRVAAGPPMMADADAADGGASTSVWAHHEPLTWKHARKGANRRIAPLHSGSKKTSGQSETPPAAKTQPIAEGSDEVAEPQQAQRVVDVPVYRGAPQRGVRVGDVMLPSGEAAPGSSPDWRAASAESRTAVRMGSRSSSRGSSHAQTLKAAGMTDADGDGVGGGVVFATTPDGVPVPPGSATTTDSRAVSAASLPLSMGAVPQMPLTAHGAGATVIASVREHGSEGAGADYGSDDNSDDDILTEAAIQAQARKKRESEASKAAATQAAAAASGGGDGSGAGADTHAPGAVSQAQHSSAPRSAVSASSAASATSMAVLAGTPTLDRIRGEAANSPSSPVSPAASSPGTVERQSSSGELIKAPPVRFGSFHLLHRASSGVAAALKFKQQAEETARKEKAQRAARAAKRFKAAAMATRIAVAAKAAEALAAKREAARVAREAEEAAQAEADRVEREAREAVEAAAKAEADRVAMEVAEAEAEAKAEQAANDARIKAEIDEENRKAAAEADAKRAQAKREEEEEEARRARELRRSQSAPVAQRGGGGGGRSSGSAPLSTPKRPVRPPGGGMSSGLGAISETEGGSDDAGRPSPLPGAEDAARRSLFNKAAINKRRLDDEFGDELSPLADADNFSVASSTPQASSMRRSNSRRGTTTTNGAAATSSGRMGHRRATSDTTHLEQSHRALQRSNTAAPPSSTRHAGSSRHHSFNTGRAGTADGSDTGRTTGRGGGVTQRERFVSDQEKAKRRRQEMKRRRRERAAAKQLAQEREAISRELTDMNEEEWAVARAKWWPRGAGSRRDGEWRTVHVFIVSTFQDFRAERDRLVSEIFPALNMRCRSRRVHFVPVDLHFGLHSEDDQTGVTSIEGQLRDIDRCRPFVIVLSGERFGQVPASYRVSSRFPWVRDMEPGASVIEIQLRHALLRKPYEPVYAFNYERDADFLDDIWTPEEQAVFAFEHPEGAGAASAEEVRARRDELRRRVRAHPYVKTRPYHCRFEHTHDEAHVQVTGLEQFELTVMDDLWGVVRREFPPPPPPDDPLEAEATQHADLAELRAMDFTGRDATLAELNHLSMDRAHKDGPPIVVRGHSGAGMSSLVSTLYKRLATTQRHTICVLHAVRATPTAADIRHCLTRVTAEVAKKMWLDVEPANSYQDVKEQFFRILHQAGKSALMRRTYVLIIFEGIALMHDEHGAHGMDWLPSVCPAGTRIMVSCTTPSEVDSALKARNPKPTIYTLPPLTMSDRIKVCEHYLESAGWAMSPDNVNRLCDNEDAGKPLYLNVACAELRRQADGTEDTDEAATALVEGLPGRTPELLDTMLERVERDIAAWTATTGSRMVRSLLGVQSHKEPVTLGSLMSVASPSARRHKVEVTETHLQLGRSLVRDALCLLMCSRHGLMEPELLQLMAPGNLSQLPMSVWHRIFRSLETFIQVVGQSTGVLDLFHLEMRRAVQHRYMSGRDSAAMHDYHVRLSHFFRKKADPAGDSTWGGNDSRAFSDMVWYQSRALDLKGMRDTLVSLKFVEARAERGAESLDHLLGELHRALFTLQHSRSAAVRKALAEVGSTRKAEEKLFEDFIVLVSRHMAAISHFPHLVFQLGMDQPDDSLPHVIAQRAATELVDAMKSNIRRFAENPALVDEGRPGDGGGSDSNGGGDGEPEGKGTDDADNAPPRPRKRRPSQTSLVPDDDLDLALSHAPRWWFDRLNKERVSTLLADYGDGCLHAEVYCCDVSPDARHIAVGLKNSWVQVLDADTGETTLEMVGRGHTEAVTCIAYSKDGQRLVTGSHDSLVVVWNTATGEVASVLSGHMRAITAVVWLQTLVETRGTARMMATSSMDLSVVVWKQTFPDESGASPPPGGTGAGGGGGGDSGTDSDSSADGPEARYVNLGAERYVSVWTKDFLPAPVVSMSLCDAVHFIAAVRSDGYVHVWDSVGGEFGIIDHSFFQAHEGTLATAIDISGTGTEIATGALDSKVRFHQLSESHESWFPADASGGGHSGGVTCVRFSPNSRTLVSTAMDRMVCVWNVELRELMTVLTGHTRGVYDASFFPGSSRVVTCAIDPAVKIWDTESARVVSAANKGQSQVKRAVEDTKLGGNRRSLVASSGLKRRKTFARERKGAAGFHSGRVTCIAMQERRRIAVTGAADCEIKVWNVLTGEERFVLLGHTATVTALHFTGDNLLLSTDKNGVLIAWDATTWDHVITIAASHAPLYSVTSHVLDGAAVAAAGAPAAGGARVDSAGRARRHRAKCIAYVGDGKGRVTVWDVREGQKYGQQPKTMLMAPVYALSVARASTAADGGAAPHSALPLTVDRRGHVVSDDMDTVLRTEVEVVGRAGGLRGHRHHHLESNAHFHNKLFGHAFDELQGTPDHLTPGLTPAPNLDRLIAVCAAGQVVAHELGSGAMREASNEVDGMVRVGPDSSHEDSFMAVAISRDASRVATASQYKASLRKSFVPSSPKKGLQDTSLNPLAHLAQEQEAEAFDMTQLVQTKKGATLKQLQALHLRPPLMVAPLAVPGGGTPASLAHILDAPLAVDVRSWGRVHPPARHEASTRADADLDEDEERAWEIKRDNAAIKIQAVARGFISRDKLQWQLDQEAQATDSASRIQALARGRSSRKIVSKDKQTKELALSIPATPEAEAKAAKLQAVARGRRTRKEAKQKQEAAAKIGAVARGRRDRKAMEAQQAAAAKLQATQRGRKARQEIGTKHDAAAKLQAIARGRAERRNADAKARKKAAKKERLAARAANAASESAASDPDDDSDDGSSAAGSASGADPTSSVYTGTRYEPPMCTSVSFSDDGAMLAAGSTDHTVSVLSAARPHAGPIAQFFTGAECTAVCVGPGLLPSTWTNIRHQAREDVPREWRRRDSVDAEEARTDADNLKSAEAADSDEPEPLAGAGDGSVALVVAGDATGRVYFMTLKDAARVAESEVQREDIAARDTNVLDTSALDGGYSDFVLPPARRLSFDNGRAVQVLALHRGLGSIADAAMGSDIEVAKRLWVRLGLEFTDAPFSRAIENYARPRMRRRSSAAAAVGGGGGSRRSLTQELDDTAAAAAAASAAFAGGADASESAPAAPTAAALQWATRKSGSGFMAIVKVKALKTGHKRRRSLARRAMAAMRPRSAKSGRVDAMAAIARQAQEAKRAELARIDAARVRPPTKKFLAPSAVVCVFGGGEGLHELMFPNLRPLIFHGVVKAAAAVGAMVVDDGTESGVSGMVGAAANGHHATEMRFVGLAQAAHVKGPQSDAEALAELDREKLEPHHTDFLLLQDDAASRGHSVGCLLKPLAQHMVGVVVVANGGDDTKHRVLQCVRLQMPVVVITETGRFADELGAAVARVEADDDFDSKSIEDPIVREIATCDRVTLFPLAAEPAALDEVVRGLLKSESDRVNPLAGKGATVKGAAATSFQIGPGEP